MDRYSRKHLADGALLIGFKAHVANERGSLADVLADIGEIDERKLYVPAAHPSMVSYMVHEMRFTEAAALKRLRAARLAREFPAIFVAVAQGRLHLTAIVALSGHLDAESADELLAAAEGKTVAELERWLHERKSMSDLPLACVPSADATGDELSLRRVEATHNPVETPVATSSPQPEERSELRCLLDREGHEALDYARALLGHSIPNGDTGRIVSRAAKALVRELEKQKFGATDRPRKQRGSSDPRHIPFAVKREVWKRDGGQCSFHSEQGKCCPSRELLEFHHIAEVALGGTASVENISLRCRTHNQYESERTFGKPFMQHKRDQAREAAAKRRTEKEAARELAEAAAERRREERETEREQARAAVAKRREQKEAKRTAQDALDNDELMPGLRGLGCTIERARSVLATVGPMEGFPIEARLKRCISMLAAPHTRITPNGAAAN